MLAHDQAYSKRKSAKKFASRVGRLKPGGTM
jgi:hypothetical protein